VTASSASGPIAPTCGAAPYITADVPRLAARLERPDVGLVLVSRRHLRSNNSWLHNVEPLVRGRDRCTLLMHPADAARAGLADGEQARVTSDAGAVEVAVQVSDEMMPGVVSLPHGWGHDKPDTRLEIARAHAGVNSNLLAPGRLTDPVSNNAVVNGIPVDVRPKTTSWVGREGREDAALGGTRDRGAAAGEAGAADGYARKS